MQLLDYLRNVQRDTSLFAFSVLTDRRSKSVVQPALSLDLATRGSFSHLTVIEAKKILYKILVKASDICIEKE